MDAATWELVPVGQPRWKGSPVSPQSLCRAQKTPVTGDCWESWSQVRVLRKAHHLVAR